MSAPGRRPSPALPTVVRRTAASLLTVAAALGVMGLATFGRFDTTTDPITQSHLAAPHR